MFCAVRRYNRTFIQQISIDAGKIVQVAKTVYTGAGHRCDCGKSAVSLVEQTAAAAHNTDNIVVGNVHTQATDARAFIDSSRVQCKSGNVYS